MTTADPYARLRAVLGDAVFEAAFTAGLHAPPPSPQLLAELRVLVRGDDADRDIEAPAVA
jgi:hypothetical protein